LIQQNISLDGVSVELKREEILNYFLDTYETFEKLFEIFINDDVFYEQPEELRHKLIFYFGHTASFFINKLIYGKYITERVNAKYECIFAIGVDEMVWDDLKNISYPTVKQSKEYRLQVKNVVVEYIKNLEFTLPITWDSPMWVILMGIEHENIHIETSSVLHRQLDISLVKEHKEFIPYDKSDIAPFNKLIEVEGTTLILGKPHDANDYYGWDNEYGSRVVEIEDFQASKYLVSNQEFLEFVNANGYENNHYWDDEALQWKDENNISHPPFWIQDGDKYLYRTLTKVIELPLNWPVEVNAHEANAFCQYKSEQTKQNITLPCEAQYQRLRDVCNIPYEVEENANIGKTPWASSTPIDMYKQGEFYDVVGNVWQWSSSCIDAYDDFKVHPLYDDFSTPTFDNQHALIKGCSWITRGNGILKDSRYAFRKHFYQHAGFRYIQSDKDTSTDVKIYENEDDVASQCDEQYGDKHSNIFEDIAKVAQKYAPKSTQKVLNIACGVGRVSFELKRYFPFVTGIDFSARFIVVATKLKDKKFISYNSKNISLENLDFTGIDMDGLEFWQGDACNLKPHFHSYDVVVSVDLLSHLYDREKFLSDITDRINKDGVIIFANSDIDSLEGFENIDCSSDKVLFGSLNIFKKL